MAALDERLQRLQGELNDHERIARHLGLDFQRPIQSLGDGYPENAVALVGRVAERMEFGLRSDYVELVLSRSAGEVRQVLDATQGELLRTEFPKTTRFLVLDEDPAGALGGLQDYRVVTYNRFLDTIVDLDAHLSSVMRLDLLSETRIPIPADLLVTDERSGNASLSQVGDAFTLLADAASGGGNLLVVGGTGTGKTVLLQRLAAAGRTGAVRRYRFYFDMGLKRSGESFAEFASRTLAPCMSVEPSKVFDVFHYFVRSGSVVCAFDGIDEAVQTNTLAGFLELFTDIAEVLSAESAVVMSSRVSFLEDSPEVRRLLDGTALLSERLIQQLHAEGVDPLSIPRFSALRLHDESVPLQRQLSELLGHDGPLPDLLWARLTSVAAQSGLLGKIPALVEYFGRAYLDRRTTFTLVELFNSLGADLFDDRITYAEFRLRHLFRTDGADRVAFVHSAYQELLTAEYLRSPAAREQAAAGQPRLTEQIRAFLHHRWQGGVSTDDCVLPAGTYLVGPSHHLMLRQVTKPVLFDRHAVTVSRYNEFLAAGAAAGETGSGEWNHPDQPPNVSHQPWQDRLRVQDYYTSPAYADYPAICISWWSAYAFARFEGKRLPTSLEWEAAARGIDGRLFPWGDDIDLTAVNCADSYSGRPLVTYEAWLEEHDRGALRDAFPGPVQSFEKNRSPFGVHQMAGNVWEFTSTVLAGRGDVVICGGSFDNPYRAVQASAKGLSRLRVSSNALGFRCVRDLP